MSNALKRGRSEPSVESKLADIPPLHGDIILQIFTHKSLDFPGSSQKVFGDNARLAELGQQALELAVTHTLFHLKHPMLAKEEIAMHREGLLADESIEYWVNSYNLRERVRCLPEVLPSLDTAEERRFLFNSYVGAVCIQNGPQVVQKWVTQLILPDWNQRDQTLEADVWRSGTCSLTPPPSKRIKCEPAYVTVSLGQLRTPVVPPRFFSASQFTNSSGAAQSHMRRASASPPDPSPQATPPPPQTTSPPPQTTSPPPQKTPSPPQATPPQLQPPSTSQPNPLTPARPNTQFLLTFNQAAMKRKVKVTYQTSSSGPAHALVWHASCIVNDILKGYGNGGSKQHAKEAAARQAYYSMGWAPHAS